MIGQINKVDEAESYNPSDLISSGLTLIRSGNFWSNFEEIRQFADRNSLQ